MTHFTVLNRLTIGLLVAALWNANTTFAAPPVTNLEYDANGNPTKQTNSIGAASTQQYDAVDRLILQSQPHPITANTQLGNTTTQYNAVDEVTGITDPRSLATGYTKNAFGDVLTLTSPDTGTTNNTYDNAGNLLTKADAVGRVATYTYDATNRVTKITYKPSVTGAVDETRTYTYDQGINGVGHLTSMTDLSGSTAWRYDDHGRILRKQQQIGTQSYNLETMYDTAGRLATIGYPSTHYVDYQYNVNGQVSQISVDSNVMLSNIQYFATGTVKSWIWGNGQTHTRSIDSDGRIASLTMGDQLQVITYDNAGRITQLHRTLPATPNTPIPSTVSTYAYDNLDRLTTNISSSIQGYQYDLNGNRTLLSLGANSYTNTIAATSNRLTAEFGPTARTYTYNTAGSITGNGQDTYTYYSSGRLKQVTRAAANIYGLQYNGLGQFVNRTNSNVRYLYDEAGYLLGEYNSTGDLIQETVWLGDTPVITIRPDSLQRNADNTDTATTNKAAKTGTWTTATTLKGFYGTNYFTHAAAPSTTDKIVYTITPTATQNFRVYTRWVAQATNATNATYTVSPNTAGSTPSVFTVDQTQNGGIWMYLGSYNLNTANKLTVSLSGQGNGIVVADAVRIIPNTPANIQNEVNFVHADQLDTPRVIKNYANQTRWYWYPELSEAFGANVPNENPSALGVFAYNLRFPGQLYDPSSGLSYNYYRDYNSRTGRYVESDPIGLEGGINTYGYVGGNPLGLTDRRGLNAGVGVGVGALLFCARYPSLCVAGGLAVCRLMGGCKIPDNFCSSTANGSDSSGAPATPPAPPTPAWPGSDPTAAPPDTEWRGKPGSTPGDGNGNYVNPETGESYRPDLNHPGPIGPHWDHKDTNGDWGRIFPDGTRVPK